MRQKLRIDALSRVPNSDLSKRVRAFQRNIDTAVRRRELNGIGQQVPHDLLQSSRITGDLGNGLQSAAQLNAFCLRGRTHDIDCIENHTDKIQRLDLQFELAARDPSRIQEVLDELQLRFAVSFNDVHEVFSAQV